jgi:hypothetical protein
VTDLAARVRAALGGATRVLYRAARWLEDGTPLGDVLDGYRGRVLDPLLDVLGRAELIAFDAPTPQRTAP